MEAMESGAEVESLQKTIYQGENHDISLMDRIPEKENGQEKLLNRIFLEELLGRLPAKERQLIYMRYFQDMTQAQIAGKLGISQVQVSRMEKKILTADADGKQLRSCLLCKRKKRSKASWLPPVVRQEKSRNEKEKNDGEKDPQKRRHSIVLFSCVLNLCAVKYFYRVLFDRVRQVAKRIANIRVDKQSIEGSCFPLFVTIQSHEKETRRIAARKFTSEEAKTWKTNGLQQLKENIAKVMIGNERTIELVLTCLVAKGHILLEDVPGDRKNGHGEIPCEIRRGRVRPHPVHTGLTASDVTGLNYFDAKSGEFVFSKGPAFCNILLADEINRATPKTQSSLLECMAERQITVTV